MKNVDGVIAELREYQWELGKRFPEKSCQEIQKMVEQFLKTFYDYKNYYYEGGNKMNIKDAYFCAYSVSREVYLDMLIDDGLSKDIAKRLVLEIDNVTVNDFKNPDECVQIGFDIIGSEEDLAVVDKILKKRYGDDENDDENDEDIGP